MSVMNIGIVTTWFERGAAYVSKQYKDSLEERGHKLFIYSRGGEISVEEKGKKWRGEEIHEGKKVPFPESTYIDLDDFLAWIDGNNIEVVLFNEQRWLPPVLLCKQLGVRCGSYVDYYTKKTVESFGIYDFLICNTKRHNSVFKWHKQCFYIPWGTDTSLFTGEFRKPSDVLRFFTSVGMSPDRKGLDLTVKAFIDLINGKIIDVELIIHSQLDVSEFLRERLSLIDYELYQRLVEGHKVRLISETVTAPGLYYLGDVYVYPSRLDGIGLTIAEALSSGMPVIVPNEPPMNEYLCQYSTAVSVERRFARHDAYYWESNEASVKSICDAFLSYYERREDILDIQYATRKNAVETLSWKSRTSAIESAFSDSEVMWLGKKNFHKYNNAFNPQFPLISQLQHVYKLVWGFAKSDFFKAFKKRLVSR